MDNGEFLDKLFERCDIVQIVSRYTHLTKKGGSYWGCCPFHHEKTPSFKVDAAKGLYHCFGCNAGGNVITFVSEIESVDRGEAVRILAKEANMEVPVFRQNGSNPVADAKKRERLYKLMREAARHYHDNLSLPAAAPAREYLERRKVGENLVRRFGLGYSVSGGEMISYLEGLGYTKAEMKEAGIAAQRADEYYDVFYGRLIFPILSNMGEVVSFGGRVLSSNPDFAKYRNGSQTFIFDKSRNIYAVNLLKKRKQREGLPYAIMTEGYMDVISLHKAGFDMAVASMGTSLTTQQAKLIKNLCDRIYISYDGDGAGQKATIRGLDILAEAGLVVKVIELPDGLDPDDVINKYGREFYEGLIEKAVTLPQFKINTLLRTYDLSKSDEKANFAVEASKVIKSLSNPVEQEEYLGRIHEITGYTLDALYKQIDLAQTDSRTSEPQPNGGEIRSPAVVDPALRFVLASILAEKEYCDYTLDLFPYLPDELSRRIYQRGLKAFRSGEKSGLASFYEQTPESERLLLDELNAYEFLVGDDSAKFAECVKNLAIRALREQKSDLARKIEQTGDVSLLGELRALDEKIKEIRNGSDS